MKKVRENNKGGLPSLNEEQKRSIDLNVKLQPGQDSDPLWREKNRELHDAFLILDKRRPYANTPDKIKVFATPFGSNLSVGTTKTSIAKFWVGVGALKKRNDSYIETILTPSQLEHTETEWTPVSIAGLEGKNFKKIRISNGL